MNRNLLSLKAVRLKRRKWCYLSMVDGTAWGTLGLDVPVCRTVQIRKNKNIYQLDKCGAPPTINNWTDYIYFHLGPRARCQQQLPPTTLNLIWNVRIGFCINEKFIFDIYNRFDFLTNTNSDKYLLENIKLAAMFWFFDFSPGIETIEFNVTLSSISGMIAAAGRHHSGWSWIKGNGFLAREIQCIINLRLF